ncbi:putative non-heme bromoperoxidase BpoC [compost metagenome]
MTQFLTLPEGRIAYDVQGTGPVVLCVPSLGDRRQEYRFLVPILVQAGYRVVTMDLRGHGETSVRWPDYSVVGVGSDIVALARHLNAGPVTVIGTSLAAGAAVWAAAEDPAIIQGLVLIGAFVRDFGPAWKARLLSLPFQYPWGPSLWASFYASLYPTSKPVDFASYQASLRANLKEPGRLKAFRAMVATSKAASEARLSQVSTPVLVVMGTKDPDFPDPEGEGRRIASELDGMLHVIPGAGHYPHAEMPEETAAPIAAFLDGLWKEVRRGA